MQNQTIRTMLAGILVVTGATGFVWWRLTVPPRHPGHDAILVDTSDSQLRGCDKVAAIVQADVRDARMGRGATITLFGLGRSSTANEAELIETFTLPDTSGIMGGPGSITTKEQELVSRVMARCEEIPQTTVSPLHQAFTRIVSFLQAEDRSAEAYLVLHAITDGEETEVREIKHAFDQKPGSKITLPSVINNERVRVDICGAAQTVGTVTVAKGKIETKTRTRDAVRAEREDEVWKKAFSQQDMVHINPFCIPVTVTLGTTLQGR